MNYVLIPGAGGSAWYWHLLGVQLRRLGHGVTAVDLPAADESAGLADYVDTVLSAIGSVTGELTLVGQSLGGFTAAEVACRIPVVELVFLNAMIPQPGESAGDWWGNTGQEDARRAHDVAHGRDPKAEFDAHTYFLHDVPADVVQDSVAHNNEQSSRVFGQPVSFDRWPAVPMRALAGLDDRFLPFDFQRRVARERLGLEVHGLPGGHLAALARPRELAAALTGAEPDPVAP